MTNLNRFLNRIANWKSFLIFFGIYLLFAGYIFKNAENRIDELAGQSIGIIDLTLGFNPQKTLNMVAEYGVAARAYYAKVEMTIDAVYPIVYAFLLAIILTLFYRKKRFTWINKLPFIVVAFDYIENINIIILLHSYPQQSPIIATLCEVFKLLKWITLGIIFLLVIFGLISKLFNKKKASFE
jgi:hypothetical protein